MTHGHYIISSYAWDRRGRGMVVLDNPLGLESKNIVYKAMITGLLEPK